MISRPRLLGSNFLRMRDICMQYVTARGNNMASSGLPDCDTELEPPDTKRPKLDDGNSSPLPNESEAPDMAKTRVALALCGSMSPVTFLHLRMFEVARDYLHDTGKYTVEQGIISPVHDSYGKKGLVASKHRLAMCEQATKTSDWIRVDPWEAQQPGWLQTIYVLAQLQEKVSAEGEVKLFLLCGADLLQSFENPNLWTDEEITEIVEKYSPVVISRDGSHPERIIDNHHVLSKLKAQGQIHTINTFRNDVSSTEIRRCLFEGKSVKYLIPDEVIDYIKKNKLYQEQTPDAAAKVNET